MNLGQLHKNPLNFSTLLLFQNVTVMHTDQRVANVSQKQVNALVVKTLLVDSVIDVGQAFTIILTVRLANVTSMGRRG